MEVNNSNVLIILNKLILLKIVFSTPDGDLEPAQEILSCSLEVKKMANDKRKSQRWILRMETVVALKGNKLEAIRQNVLEYPMDR